MRPEGFVARARRYFTALDCRVTRADNERLIGRGVIDLSRSGARIMETATAHVGERVHVSFLDPRWRLGFSATGEICRIGHGRRACDRGRHFGIAFVELDGFSDYLLLQTLWGLMPTTPER